MNPETIPIPTDTENLEDFLKNEVVKHKDLEGNELTLDYMLSHPVEYKTVLENANFIRIMKDAGREIPAIPSEDEKASEETSEVSAKEKKKSDKASSSESTSASSAPDVASEEKEPEGGGLKVEPTDLVMEDAVPPPAPVPEEVMTHNVAVPFKTHMISAFGKLSFAEVAGLLVITGTPLNALHKMICGSYGNTTKKRDILYGYACEEYIPAFLCSDKYDFVDVPPASRHSYMSGSTDFRYPMTPAQEMQVTKYNDVRSEPFNLNPLPSFTLAAYNNFNGTYHLSPHQFALNDVVTKQNIFACRERLRLIDCGIEAWKFLNPDLRGLIANVGADINRTFFRYLRLLDRDYPRGLDEFIEPRYPIIKMQGDLALYAYLYGGANVRYPAFLKHMSVPSIKTCDVIVSSIEASTRTLQLPPGNFEAGVGADLAFITPGAGVNFTKNFLKLLCGGFGHEARIDESSLMNIKDDGVKAVLCLATLLVVPHALLDTGDIRMCLYHILAPFYVDTPLPGLPNAQTRQQIVENIMNGVFAMPNVTRSYSGVRFTGVMNANFMNALTRIITVAMGGGMALNPMNSEQMRLNFKPDTLSIVVHQQFNFANILYGIARDDSIAYMNTFNIPIAVINSFCTDCLDQRERHLIRMRSIFPDLPFSGEPSNRAESAAIMMRAQVVMAASLETLPHPGLRNAARVPIGEVMLDPVGIVSLLFLGLSSGTMLANDSNVLLGNVLRPNLRDPVPLPSNTYARACLVLSIAKRIYTNVNVTNAEYFRRYPDEMIALVTFNCEKYMTMTGPEKEMLVDMFKNYDSDMYVSNQIFYNLIPAVPNALLDTWLTGAAEVIPNDVARGLINARTAPSNNVNNLDTGYSDRLANANNLFQLPRMADELTGQAVQIPIRQGFTSKLKLGEESTDRTTGFFFVCGLHVQPEYSILYSKNNKRSAIYVLDDIPNSLIDLETLLRYHNFNIKKTLTVRIIQHLLRDYNFANQPQVDYVSVETEMIKYTFEEFDDVYDELYDDTTMLANQITVERGKWVAENKYSVNGTFKVYVKDILSPLVGNDLAATSKNPSLMLGYVFTLDQIRPSLLGIQYSGATNESDIDAYLNGDIKLENCYGVTFSEMLSITGRVTETYEIHTDIGSRDYGGIL